MQFQKGFVVPLLLGIIVLLLVGGEIYLYTKKNRPPTETQTGAATTTQTQLTTVPQQTGNSTQTKNGSLQTYTDSQYSFAFTYPSDFIPWTQLSSSQKIESYIPVCDSTDSDQVTCLYYAGSKIPDIQAAAMQVLASTTVTYDDCTRIWAGDSDLTNQVSINGIVFYHDQTGDAGLGNRLSTDEYRTYYNGACYEIELSIGWNVAEGNGPNQDSMNQLSNELQSVFSTFHFTAPQTVAPLHSTTTTPIWSTIVGREIPISFQYPGVLSVTWNGGTTLGIELSLVQQVGLDTLTSENGLVNVGDVTKLDPTLDAVKTNNNDPDTVGFNTLTLGGAPALQSQIVGNETQWSVYFVAHEGRVYRIMIKSPLPGEANQLLQTFTFTN